MGEHLIVTLPIIVIVGLIVLACIAEWGLGVYERWKK